MIMLECAFMIIPLFIVILLNASLLKEIFVNEKMNKTLETMLTSHYHFLR
jgi:ABC-type Na+ efflux pump permease subunit